MTKKLTNITPDALLAMLDTHGQKKVKQKSGLRGPDAFVVFENLVTDSPEFGKRTIIPVGKNHLYNSVADLHGAWLGEGPHRQDAVAYCLTPIT